MLIMVNDVNTDKINRTNKLNNDFWEDKKIRSILGYPVKRVICDRQGNIILNVGDIIGFQALERVKQADKLDYLFSSVYRK